MVLFKKVPSLHSLLETLELQQLNTNLLKAYLEIIHIKLRNALTHSAISEADAELYLIKNRIPLPFKGKSNPYGATAESA